MKRPSSRNTNPALHTIYWCPIRNQRNLKQQSHIFGLSRYHSIPSAFCLPPPFPTPVLSLSLPLSLCVCVWARFQRCTFKKSSFRWLWESNPIIRSGCEKRKKSWILMGVNKPFGKGPTCRVGNAVVELTTADGSTSASSSLNWRIRRQVGWGEIGVVVGFHIMFPLSFSPFSSCYLANQ